jgi:hypothetical protein
LNAKLQRKNRTKKRSARKDCTFRFFRDILHLRERRRRKLMCWEKYKQKKDVWGEEDNFVDDK